MKHVALWMAVVVMAAGALAACSQAGAPNDVVDAQAKARSQQAAPDATALPPGLSNDLPTPPAPEPNSR